LYIRILLEIRIFVSTTVRTYKTEAIILKRINFSEADKILTLYTKHYGKISAIAKGVRKLTSRKAASLELFNHVDLFLVKGKNLDIVTETTLINSFPNFRKDLRRIKLAYEACEVIERLTVEEKGNTGVFLKLKDFLYGLEKASRVRPWRTPGSDPAGLTDFKSQILSLLGFGTLKTLTLETINTYIETIIEKKLVAGKILDNTN